jgi:RND family efflux transporter MFP subunit
VAIARARVELNEAEMRRVQNLYRENNASESEYNRVTLAYQQSLQNLQTQENMLALIGPRRLALEAQRDAQLNQASIAQLDVDRCRIVAPFSGQVEEVMVEVGDSVRIGSPLVRLLSPDRLEIPLQVPVSRRLELAVGTECVLTLDSLADVEWTGTVCRLSPSADEQSRTFAAYVEVDNARQPVPLVPGFFVKAQIRGPLLRDVFVLPRGTIADGQVFLAANGKAVSRPVRVQRYLRDQAVVVGDLAAGDHVITTNLDVLFDGAPIRAARDATPDPPVTTRTSVAGDPSPPTPVQ